MRDALSRVVAWLSRRSDRSGEADKTGDESGGFAGSRLDASVNQGHGQGDPRAASEMAAVQAEADRLTQTDQHRE
ncbi:hypothetical protein BDK61_3365 [Haloarcula quadrata]|uniref:Uncharacterized protein n=1 Tax=Haloarcula quadrata TaxID=182779 RepID=A0A495RAT0_9EURY|nr:hypothetical protein [Haloarcula quadrata]RKS83968.1 hypothetical protein BDK61_3365 [Haloarcula quadrata]